MAGVRAAAFVEAGGFLSPTYTHAHFGGNFILGRDALDGTFGETARSLGISTLRYPGGGVTEDIFRPDDPDRVPPSFAGTLDTLSAFLAHCAREGVEPVIVLPTKRYLADIEAGAAEIAAFVARVTSGEFGAVRIAGFEIGNEYYAATAEHPAISAAQYGRIASRFAEVVREAAAYPVEIGVQIGKSPAENAAILAAFDTAEERAAVTELVYHDYPWRAESVLGRVSDRAALIDAWEAAGIKAQTHMSEWNVGSDRDQATDSEHDYGMRQLPAMIEILSQNVRAGLDRACVWAIQQNNKTSLSPNEGQGTLSAAGYLFRLMAESLPGTREIAVDLSAPAMPELDVWAFESARSVTLFLSAGAFDAARGPASLRINVEDLPGSFSHAFFTELSAAGNPDAYRPTARLSIGETAVRSTRTGDETVTVRFDEADDVVRLVLLKTAAGARAPAVAQGETGSGTGGNDVIGGQDGADRLLGRGGHDVLRGDGGDDVLSGARGFDLLEGGAGHDLLLGGAETDRLFGGDGDDRLQAGSGDDLLVGGTGADSLAGDHGVDLIEGGEGDDLLSGGVDMDYFEFGAGHGADTITDFEIARDVIDLSGTGTWNGLWALRHRGMTDTEAGVLIDTGEGTVLLAGVGSDALAFENFLFS